MLPGKVFFKTASCLQVAFILYFQCLFYAKCTSIFKKTHVREIKRREIFSLFKFNQSGFTDFFFVLSSRKLNICAFKKYS